MIKCYCGGELNLDLEETRANGILPVYNCSNCNNLIVLQVIGEKKRGWRTKKVLDNKNKFSDLPF